MNLFACFCSLSPSLLYLLKSPCFPLKSQF
jgi:hypothetical protein